MSKKLWTHEEISFLQNNYPTKGRGYCAIKLARSKDSIARKAERLNIRSNTVNFWTQEEDNFLLDNYSNSGAKYCAIVLNRSVFTTRRRASILGVQVLNPGGKYSNEEYDFKLFEVEAAGYVIEDYKGYHIPIKHCCVEGHIWEVSPSNILGGSGCPHCATKIFNPTKPAILYYIKIFSKDLGTFYKIGITNRDVSRRFWEETELEITTLKEEKFKIGDEARDKEREILNKYSSKRVKVSNLLKSGGNTELFKEDVLGLDTEKAQ